MLRLNNEKTPKKSSEMDRPGKRKPGRPKGRWKRTIETEMKSTRYNWNNISLELPTIGVDGGTLLPPYV